MASPLGWRTLQDSSVNPSATFALPSAASLSTNSTTIDLGTDAYKPEDFELELSIPSLTSVIAPSTVTAGVTYIIESSTTSAFSAVARTLASKNQVPSGAGIGATVLRTRVPSDCERYVRGKVTFGATATDGSAVVGTLSARF